MKTMKRIYDYIFLLGVKAHILLDRVLTAIETRFGRKNGSGL